MMTGSLSPLATQNGPLGDYLRDRRRKLDPAATGCASGRRRTPGLRREEVAQRAGISTNWYVCLEQGRGGAPSSDVLERLARALLLSEAERRHLFLIGQGRPPEPHFRREDRVEPRLQRILDALSPALAFVRTATWDVVAWNDAVATLMVDYASIAPQERNFLRFVFLDPMARTVQHDWEGVARAMVAAFRAAAAGAGALAAVEPLVRELSERSPDFRAMWRDNDVRAIGRLSKLVLHPTLGPIELDCSDFAVDGRHDLAMVVFDPIDRGVALKISKLLADVKRSSAGDAARRDA